MRKDILICRCLEFFALQKIGMTIKGLSYSCLTRVSMDPRNKSEDDCYKKNESEDDERVRAKFLICTGMTFICCLLSSTAHAECTPAPDCASIGYTETSCETTSLKCPFDTSKLKCLPCDSTFRYTCSGDNIAGGVGDSCNNKYARCSCVEGATFNNGVCVCDTSCKVGAIYYSDKTCSSCVNSSKTAIGIVVKDNELIISLEYTFRTWAPNNIDFPEIENVDATTAQTQMNGYSETQAIVNYYGDDTDDSNIAALYCYNYFPSNAENTKKQWYLPAAGELYNYVYLNYATLNNTATLFNISFYNYFFSTTEIGNNAFWRIHTGIGNINFTYKNDTNTAYKTICFLNI